MADFITINRGVRGGVGGDDGGGVRGDDGGDNGGGVRGNDEVEDEEVIRRPWRC